MLVFEKKYNKVQLDVLDHKIISALGKNCRLNESQISKMVSRSREVVSYRIKKLEENGIIAGYITGINLKALGYFTSHMFIQFRNFSPEQEEIILSKLKKLEYINAIIVFIGSWDLEVSIVSKDIFELYNYVYEIVDLLNPLDYELVVRLESTKVGSLPKQGKKISSRSKSKYDEVDLDVLNLISNDAKLSYSQIGKELKMSGETVKYRMNNLVKNNIITDFRPVLNYEALGYNMMVLLVSLTRHNLDVDKKIKLYADGNEILWIAKGLGKWDIIVYVLSKTTIDNFQAIKRLRNIFGNDLKQYSSLFGVREPKYTYFTKNMYTK